jgi:hypothetical protein
MYGWNEEARGRGRRYLGLRMMRVVEVGEIMGEIMENRDWKKRENAIKTTQ